ncbi:pilus assembly protein N-terminal domain-containing protein [Bradyrhizobium tropiciagri]|uniref:pilus assembly protein N-terminal domain-containing protein n=1 Tax=Bradyrhizobium tropiciagri TaxID=312253 RepID=UPI001BA5154B|nr:pilus assembly protein N-terminal domain-containing protein [Bradyrhizobium tropiciagri]MBR0875461.1 pilus assembly protein N-terminal domain-containing protein [Bradyrhizobium tropiciagri]
MKRIVLIAAALLMSGGVFAQPREVIPTDQISLARGQIKVLIFDEQIGRINVVGKGIIEAEPQTDKQLSIEGIGSGSSQIFVFSNDGKQIYSAAVVVTAELGRLVKIYGNSKNDDPSAGHTLVWCNEFGCGRPDGDLSKATAPAERVRIR